MSVTIGTEVENRVRPWLESGQYESTDDVLLEALTLLEERDLDSLRAKLQIGIDQLERGERIAYTPNFVNERQRLALERLERKEKPKPDVCP